MFIVPLSWPPPRATDGGPKKVGRLSLLTTELAAVRTIFGDKRMGVPRPRERLELRVCASGAVCTKEQSGCQPDPISRPRWKIRLSAIKSSQEADNNIIMFYSYLHGSIMFAAYGNWLAIR